MLLFNIDKQIEHVHVEVFKNLSAAQLIIIEGLYNLPGMANVFS